MPGSPAYSWAQNPSLHGISLVHVRSYYRKRDLRAGTRAREEMQTGEHRRKRDIVEKRGFAAGLRARVVGVGEAGALSVAEPSLLNVNVRHLLLRMTRCCLFVSAVVRRAAWWWWSRAETQEEWRRKQWKRSTSSAAWCYSGWFLLPLFWYMSFFFFIFWCHYSSCRAAPRRRSAEASTRTHAHL